MEAEEARNLCPDCRGMVPLGALSCPHCGRRFRPARNSWWRLYAQCWLLWNKRSGRAPLLEFYAFVFSHTLFFVWCCFYMMNRLGARPWEEGGWENIPAAFEKAPWLWGAFAFFALTLVPSFSLCCRRLHDCDCDAADVRVAMGEQAEEACGHGLWLWAWELPFLMGLFRVPCLLVIEDSTPGPNRFGPATRYLRYQDGPMPRQPFN